MAELVREGVHLFYEEAGKGGPPLLFVHGFGGSTEHFRAQLEHFKRSHRVAALDRRGHGRSDKPEGPYTIAAIAEEVGWCARELGMHKPVLIVHSMGAIGLELAAQAPELLSGLAILDAPLFPPSPVQERFGELLAALRGPHYAQVIDAMCEQMIFLPTDDKARSARLHGALLQTPQHVLAATWEQLLAHDSAAAAARCSLPLLYVGGVMPYDEARLRELCPQVWIGRSVGAGHFPQLEVPDQVNPMIERFLRCAPGLAQGA
jgi:pimeloyl-ACP methyl ester carboxylesterase